MKEQFKKVADAVLAHAPAGYGRRVYVTLGMEFCEGKVGFGATAVIRCGDTGYQYDRVIRGTPEEALSDLIAAVKKAPVVSDPQ